MTRLEPLVSLVTLNYNQTKITCGFLESIRSRRYSKFEIITFPLRGQMQQLLLFLKGIM